MKLKIFKHTLLAAIALLALNTAVSAQDSLAVPPLPPVTLKLDKAFKQNMGDLKVKMKQLQKQMRKQSFKMKMDIDTKFAFKDFDKNFKDFGKTFNENFKDFGKNFSGSFSEMAPNFSGSFKNLDGINYNNNTDSEEYKQKVASGEIIEKVKSYSKSYSIDANDVLQISNSFGKVIVNTWAKKEFKVDVQMKFSADDEDYVDNMINGSSITDSKEGSVVSFKTNLARNNGSHGHNHMDVNYTVYMPAGNTLNVTNKFGSVILPDLSGKVTLSLNFCNLIAQQLTNTENYIQMKFPQNGPSSIAVLNGGRFSLAYGKFKGGIFNNVDSDISFSDVIIDRLKNSSSFRIKYGDGVNINAVDKSVKSINVNSSYSKFKVDFKDADSFNFDVVTKYGGFNYNDDIVKVTAKTPSDEDRGWSSTKSYKGYIGKNNSDGKITINASFTEVKFY